MRKRLKKKMAKKMAKRDSVVSSLIYRHMYGRRILNYSEIAKELFVVEPLPESKVLVWTKQNF